MSMNSDFFKRLLDICHSANQVFAEKLFPAPDNPDEFIFKTFTHILMAENIWYRRILRKTIDRPFDRAYFNVEECNELISENSEFLQEVLTTKKLNEEISYQRLSDGKSFTNSISDIFLHISHHAAHHRGQLARKLRERGIAPPHSDFIVFSRKEN